MFIRYISRIHMLWFEQEKPMNTYKYATLPLSADNCCTKTIIRDLPKETDASGVELSYFEMQSGGYSPLHSHPWQHRLFVLEGEGTVFDGKKTTNIHAGEAVYIKSNESHQLRTVGEATLRFLCVTIHTKE